MSEALSRRNPPRRRFVRGIGLGAFGLALPDFLAARSAVDDRRSTPKALHLDLPLRRPQPLDTWDMKPDAPAEYRGEFKPIAHRPSPASGCASTCRAPRSWPTTWPSSAR